MFEMQNNIFISYSRTDSAFVDRLEADLRKQGLSTWVDRRGLEGGRKWRKELQKAIDRSQVVLVVLSPEAIASDFVQAEYGYACDENKLVIPLYHRPCKVPLDLRDIQRINFHESYGDGFNALMKAVHRSRDISTHPTSLSSPDNTAAISPPVQVRQRPLVALAEYLRNRSLLFGTVFLLLILAIVSSVGLFYFANRHSSITVNITPSPRTQLPTDTPQATSTGGTTTTIMPYPPYKGTLALNDPLRDNSHNYQWEDSGSCEFSEDGYHVTTAIKNYTYFCNAFATNFSNFAYEVQMTVLKGDSGGLVFHADANNATFYYFGIDSTGSYTLILFTGHTSSGILQAGTIPGFHTGLGKSNLIAVVAKGDHISLYANHMHITNVTDSTYSQGQIGVAASTADSPPVEVVFSNARLWRL